MGRCDAILQQQGAFSTIKIDAGRTTSENITEWLKTASWEEFKQKQEAGLKIGFPIKGVPIEIGGNWGKDDFESWKKKLEQNNTRAFSDQESLQIVQTTVEPTIVEAWLTCMGRSGLSGGLEVTADPNILIFRAEYRPTTVSDYPPIINPGDGFQVAGGTPALQFDDGDVVPFGGIGVIIERRDGSGVTVILNTDKGKIEDSVGPLPPPSTVGENDVQLVVEDGDPKRFYLIGNAEALDEITQVEYKYAAESSVDRGITNRLLQNVWTTPPTDDRPSGFRFEKVASPYPFKSINKPGIIRLWSVVAYARLKSGQLWDYTWTAR